MGAEGVLSPQALEPTRKAQGRERLPPKVEAMVGDEGQLSLAVPHAELKHDAQERPQTLSLSLAAVGPALYLITVIRLNILGGSFTMR